MDFFAASFVVDSNMWLFLAYLNGADSYTKLQLIYLHSNDMNSLKHFFLTKKV